MFYSYNNNYYCVIVLLLSLFLLFVGAVIVINDAVQFVVLTYIVWEIIKVLVFSYFMSWSSYPTPTSREYR